MKSVVVTGVSTGIGWGITKVLLEHGYRVFGSVRKPEDAARLQAEFGSNFTPLLFDITDEAAVERAAALVEEQLGSEALAGLVNNAGVCLVGPLLYQPLTEFRQQIEINLFGPLITTRAFAPLLRAKGAAKPGRLLNISSVGGTIAAPFLGAYAASKHALEGMSESLRRELAVFGIDTIIIAPGSVTTAIWDKAGAVDLAPYAATPYAKPLANFKNFMLAEGRKGFTPEHLGKVVLKALTATKPSVRYSVVPQRLKNWTLPNLLPRRWVDRLIARQIDLRPVPAVK